MDLITVTVFTLVFLLDPTYSSSTSFVIDNIASKEECASVGLQISSEFREHLVRAGKKQDLQITYSCLPVKKAQVLESKTKK